MMAVEVERLLLDAVACKTTQPAEALSAVSAASAQTTKWHFQRHVYSLCPAAAAALRSLTYQALHGLAPERLRDQSLEALATILSSERSCIDHLWTVEEDTDGTASSGKTGSFAVFLCSIIRGEVHLLREELECYHQGGEAPEGVLRNRDERHERALRMVAVACRLVGLVLELLVGQGEEEGQEEEGGAAWSHLPSETLLQVRQALHSVFQDMLAHLLFVSDELASRRGPAGGELQSLLLVARNFSFAVCRWALEDRGLWAPLLESLPALLGCSLLCCGNSSSTEVLKGADLSAEPAGDVLLLVLPALVAVAEAAREEGDAKAAALLCRESGLVATLCSFVSNASAAATPAQVARDIAGYSSSSLAAAETIRQLRYCCHAAELLALLLHWQPEAARLPAGEQLRAAVAACVAALESEPLLLIDDSADDDNSAQAAYLDLFSALAHLQETALRR